MIRLLLIVFTTGWSAMAMASTTWLPFTSIFGWFLCGIFMMLSVVLATLWRTSVHQQRQLSLRSLQVGCDPVTGLPDRSLFDDRLAMAIYRHQRQHSRLALLVVQIRGINLSTIDHNGETPDEMLRALITIWKSALRRSDTIARLDANTFAIVLDRLDKQEGAINVAQSLVAGSETMLHHLPRYLPLRVHIGISTYPNNGLDAVTLLNSAIEMGNKVADKGQSGFQVA